MNVHWEISLLREVNSALMCAPEPSFWAQHAMSAEAGQVLIGSVCLAFRFLAAFFLVWESR
jgi:hypothetical protein